MPAPLVGIAVAAAARLAAKKLAQQGAKKVAKTATTRARANSASAAKAVAPKKPKGKLVPAKKTSTGAIKINTNPKPVERSVKVVNPSTLRNVKNRTANVTARMRKSGEAANRSAFDVKTGTPNAIVKIKSGGNIKPATTKKTIASHPANVGRAQSADRIKQDLDAINFLARKGKIVKITYK